MTVQRKLNFFYLAGGISGLVVAGYSAWVLTVPYDPTIEEWVSSSLLILSYLGFGVFGLLIYRSNRFEPAMRRAWLFLGLANLFNTIAEALWYFFVINAVDPFPSLADVFYLMYYPLMLFGILSLPGVPMTRRERIRLGLDLAIIMNAVFVLYWYIILAPLGFNPGDYLESLVALAYPLGDLLLLVGVLIILTKNTDNISYPVLLLLIAGMLFTVVADSLFGYYEVLGVDYWMPGLNIIWLIAGLLLLLGAMRQLQQPAGPNRANPARFLQTQRVLFVVLPYLAVGLAMVLQFLMLFNERNLDLRMRGVIVGILVLVALVLARQYLVLTENYQLYAEMRKMAATDSLTGLNNRHIFNEVFSQTFQRARQQEHPLTVMLVDVDGFKQINDTYGHLRGDEVLRQVADLLSQNLRNADLLSRFGGDEFVVILDNTSLPVAQAVAQRLQDAAAHAWAGQYPLGLSIGIAEIAPGMTPEALLEKADHNLYRDKKNRSQPRPNLSGADQAVHQSARADADTSP